MVARDPAGSRACAWTDGDANPSSPAADIDKTRRTGPPRGNQNLTAASCLSLRSTATWARRVTLFGHSNIAGGVSMADVTKITSGSLIAAEKVNGTDVYNMDGEHLGSVDDIMIDKVSGKAIYAVM